MLIQEEKSTESQQDLSCGLNFMAIYFIPVEIFQSGLEVIDGDEIHLQQALSGSLTYFVTVKVLCWPYELPLHLFCRFFGDISVELVASRNISRSFLEPGTISQKRQ